MQHSETVKRITNWADYRQGDRIRAGNVASNLKLTAPEARIALDAMVADGLLVLMADGSYTAPRASRALLTRAWK